MDIPGASSRFASIHSLQKLRDRNVPGSFAYEKAEHAIDLALQPARRVDDFFTRNALRDAKRVLLRQRTYFNGRLISLESRNESEDASDHGSDDSPPSEYLAIASSSDDPEIILRTNEFIARLEALACESQPAVSCLSGMMAGETVRETAQNISRSASYVKNVRARIRLHAAALLGIAA